MKIIEQTNKGRGAARNKGAQAAKGSKLIFFDDDIQVRPTAVMTYKNNLSASKPVIVGSLEPIYSENSEFSKYASYLNEKWTSTITTRDYKEPYLTASNFAILKDSFNAVNGFDERLNDNEDFDLAVRLLENNVPIFYDDQIKVGHALPKSFTQYLKRLKEYEQALKDTADINPNVLKYRKYRDKPSYKVRILKIFLRYSWIVNLMDSGALTFFPMRFRFKLYDLILTTNST